MNRVYVEMYFGREFPEYIFLISENRHGINWGQINLFGKKFTNKLIDNGKTLM